YVLVVFAAISSSISLLEVIVAHFVDKAAEKGKGDKRKKYTLVAACFVAIGCILVCADRLGGAGIHPAALLGLENYGAWAADWLDFFDMLSEGIMMPLGALLMSLMLGWEIGPDLVKEECEQEGNKLRSFGFFKICVKVITPLCMLFILYGQIKSFF
ncbi:MAG: sodium-dependent transporter, partial [Oscillospiraceae bacterium]|nr:sodium-dependent transporter [Oscillospiraceae bacterium]